MATDVKSLRMMKDEYANPQYLEYGLGLEHFPSEGDPRYYVEDIKVYNHPSDLGFKTRRELSASGNLDAQSPIVVNDVRLDNLSGSGHAIMPDKRYFAFTQAAPCTLDEYNDPDKVDKEFDKFKNKCLPAGFHDRGYTLFDVNGLFQGEDGVAVSSRASDILMKTARFYAAQMSLAKPEELKTTNYQRFDREGNETLETGLEFRTENGRGHNLFERWEFAQRCGKLPHIVGAVYGFPNPLGGYATNARGVAIGDYALCYDAQEAGSFGLVADYNKPKYDTKLVGQQEPADPIGVENIKLFDDGPDGKTDHVYARWTNNASGAMEVGIRSPYTEGALSLFDKYWANKANHVAYEYRLETEPKEVYVKAGECFDAGESLFSFVSPKDVGLKTVMADYDGCVSYLSEVRPGDDRFMLQTDVKKPFEFTVAKGTELMDSAIAWFKDNYVKGW